MNSKRFLMCLVPFFMAGCGSQSGTSGAADTSAVGNATNTTSETTTLPSKTVPDIDSFTIALSKSNPRARSWVGVEVDVSVFVADNLNDKTVLDGLVVNFAAEGGRIEPVCTISNGSCVVKWNSQAPYPSDGRATIVAWMSGSESFKDLNANGLFDGTDIFNDTDGLFPDLSEPYVNDNVRARANANRPAIYLGDPSSISSPTLAARATALNNMTFNNSRDASEVFFDTPGLTDNTFDDKDGKFSGNQCAHASLCSSLESIFIWKEREIVMSDDGIKIQIFEGDTNLTPVDTSSTPINASVSTVLRIEITDSAGNSLPGGSTIKISGTDIGAGEIENTVGNSIYAAPYFVHVGPDGTNTGGSVDIDITIPSEESVSQAVISQKFVFSAREI